MAGQQRGFSSGDDAILAADIGGTNSNFALVTRTKSKWKIEAFLQYPSKQVTDFPVLVRKVMQQFRSESGKEIHAACFAGAGPVSAAKDFCTLTHLSWNLDAHRIRKATGLKHVTIINDFDAVSYGIPLLDRKSFLLVHRGKPRQQAVKAVLGAGTGLGKSTLVWNHALRCYSPLPSEGGHADLAAQDEDEIAFIEFMKREHGKRVIPDNVAWEDALSGKGIRNIYRFLETRYAFPASAATIRIRQENYSPALILQHEPGDRHCRETVRLFLRLYARCARNFALDVLPHGGFYIAGGIAAKHPHLFQRKEFIEVFLHNRLQHALLKEIPVWVVKEYRVSLYGAAFAAWLQKGIMSAGKRGE